MTDRESVFSDQRVIDLLSEHFIALAGDDWYWRRQQDAVGEFHRRVTDQGPRGGGSGTRQGRYAFTADGQLLGFNNNRSAERLLTMLNQALVQWEDAVTGESAAPEGQVDLDPRYDRSLPEGVVVLRCWTRALSWQPETSTWETTATPRAATGGPAGAQAARDHLWLQADEIAELAVRFAALENGGTAEIPPGLALRLARFHLVDNTRGEPPMWQAGDVRGLVLEMQRIDGRRARMSGGFELATEDASRRFEGVLAGQLEFAVAPGNQAGLAAFELRALGRHEGQGRYTPGARPGAAPLAVVIELVPEPGPTDLVPPQASRDLGGYWNADR